MKRAGIRFIGLSPSCRLYCATKFPFFVSDEGIYLWNKDDLGDCDLYEQIHFDFLLFDEVEKVECDDKDLIINGSKSVHLGSSHIANYLAKKIEILKKCSSKSRRKEHEAFFESSEDSTKTITNHHNLLFLLQFFGSVLFVYTFVILPCCLYLNTPLRLNSIISVIVFFYAIVTGLSLYAHNKICKKHKKWYLFFISLLSSPVSSIHAMHMITKDMTFGFDWVELSAYLLPPGSLKTILIKELKRIYFSKEICKSKDLMSFLQFKEKQYLPFLLNVGLKHNEILESRYKNDLTAYSYCPFCETEFLKGVYKCPDCNIKLLKYGNSQKVDNKNAEQAHGLRPGKPERF
ncbi:MAG: hypothetical protein K8S18_07590 [Desulfobacula sp.]|nr:hypothetical protein [Desulfobacula sp.]